MECHQDPDNAPSDGPNMLRLDDVEKVFEDIKKIVMTIKKNIVMIDLYETSYHCNGYNCILGR